MFAGTGGSGVKNMPSKHSEVMPKKCVTCHMYREKKDEILKNGGHTFRADKRFCLKCHEDPESLAAEWRAKILPLLADLSELLDNATNKTTKAYKAAQQNYNMVTADGATGTHNPGYAQALLKHGISSLKFDPSDKP